ncbi:MAG: 3-oxosteroid 1-dehydrogenase [Proteobacteria bacterium]|nr:3-oxosteroid 1-dehydrogenase [Pseudomonadota bacterium]
MGRHSHSKRASQSPQQNRRKFIKGSVKAGAGVALASGLFKSMGATAYAAEATFDVVVIGSGAAGMTAGLTAAKRGLQVLVIEKAAKFGGSTARSGAGIWIRNNEVNQAAGVEDSLAQAEEYLAQVVGGAVPLPKQHAFLAQGPAMISFLMKNTPLRFRWMEGYSDYYPDLPGGQAQGASIEPQMFNGKILGPDLKYLEPPYIPMPPGVTIYSADYKWLCLAKVSLNGAKKAAQAVSRYVQSKLKGEVPLTMGQALAGGLRAGLQAARVPVWLGTPLLDVTLDNAGNVNGVIVCKDGVNTRVTANHGVIIAAGGFEHNLEMRRKYQQAPIGTDWTVGAAGNTGDGILAGQRAGAAVELMEDAWWGPCILLLPNQPYFCLSERSMPGSILVNAEGRRFVNESSPYHDVVNAMYRQTIVGSDLSIWLIVDQHYRDRYLFKDVLPGLPLPHAWYENGAVKKAASLADLAEQINIPVGNLEATVATFNDYAESGEDRDFGRGNNAYDRYYADPSVKPNPSLAALTKAPFYAFRIQPGDLGTKGGLKTNERSRVLRGDGTVIRGLYAAGNSSSPVMGHSYAGNGSTLGPAMTFAFIAANDIADSI